MGAAILVIIVLVAWVAMRLAPLFSEPNGQRVEHFHASLAADRRKVVVCVGDSLTQGNASFDYVHALASRLEPEGYSVLNAGVNGELAWNVLQRIEVVTRGEPAYVVLLVGTNDARACESEWAAARYVKARKLPQPPDQTFFEESYRGILDAAAAVPCTRTIVVTLPPLGERGGEPVDEIVARQNRFISAEAARRELPCVDLNAELERLLDADSRGEAPVYDARRSQWLAVRSVLLHYLLGWRWDRITKHHQMRLLPDMIHLNESAGGVLAEQVEQAVRREAAADC